MDHSRRHRKDLWISLALVALVAVVFGQTLNHSFVRYDDPVYVTENPVVQRGLTAEGLKWAVWHGADAAYWTPLAWVSHMIDVQLFGLNPAGHHLHSVLLHAADSVLLFFVLKSMTGRRWPSALAAALFAIHPLHVESVAWVAERKDLVSTLFFLLCLAAYTRYARRGGIGLYLLVLLLFGLGLMSKPMLVTVPGVLLVLDFWPLRRIASPAPLALEDDPAVPPARRRRSLGWLVLEKLPLVAMSLGISVVTVIAQQHAGAMRTLEQFPLALRVSNALVSYARYLGKTVWPVNLAVYYPPPPRWGPIVVGVSVIVLVTLSAIAVMRVRRSPYLLAGWLWFLGTLLPVIGLVQVGRQAMADRYSYLPHIGIFIAIAWTAAALAARGERARRVVVGVTAVLLLAATVRAADQVTYWKDTGTLFEHALAVTTDNAIAHNQVGNIALRAGDLDGAEAHYREALRVEPNYGLAHLNLGNVLVARKQFADAVPQFEAALDAKPQPQRAWLGLGVARRELGDDAGAAAAFAEALRRDPRLAEAHLEWGIMLQRRGEKPEAARHFLAALKIRPNLLRARRALEEVDPVAAARLRTSLQPPPADPAAPELLPPPPPAQ